jgi:diguanylate cyclase (GGDEF)-like protein
VWANPRRALVFIFGIDLLALAGLAVAGLTSATPSSGDWTRLGVLVAVAIGYTELSTRVDTIRRYVSNNKVIAGGYTIWLVAGALLLPIALAMLAAVALTVHTVSRSHQKKTGRSFRLVFSGLACAVAAGAAGVIASLTGERSALAQGHWTFLAATGVVAAAVAFLVLDELIVMCGVFLAQRPAHVRDLMMSRDNLAMETVTLVLGTFTAVVLASTPWLVPAIWVVLIVVQRAVLVTQLQAAVETDAKTGLLTSDTWERRAERELDRCGRTGTQSAVLVIDLDHFKQVNDEHGHLTGDAILKAAAEGVREELRSYDIASRHGGEEFAVLASGADATQALMIANRIRARIAERSAQSGVAVTASVGIACFPAHGTEVRELFAVADTALYDAKRAGRDIAVMSNQEPVGDDVHAQLNMGFNAADE